MHRVTSRWPGTNYASVHPDPPPIGEDRNAFLWLPRGRRLVIWGNEAHVPPDSKETGAKHDDGERHRVGGRDTVEPGKEAGSVTLPPVHLQKGIQGM